ncbi:hypothetical protein AX15_002705 [Amanita polypyramis BW_CC]|nr:hypothetical protein AX15_002705 [Amanita polypyramis BW_CC]
MQQDKQPQAVPQMTVAPGGNRNVKNLPFNASGQREWSHSLLDCFSECGTCVYAACCPCIVYSKVKHRVEYFNQHGRPDPDHGGSGCDGDCLLHCCLTGFLGIGFILQVTSIAPPFK